MSTTANTYDDYIEHDDSYEGGGSRRSLVAHPSKMRLNFFGATAAKEQWRGINLPPFDVSLIRDPNDTESYINSVGPCWTDRPDDTRFFLPGPWSRKFLFYTFLGEGNRHFLSPRVRKNMVLHRELTDMDLADAFDDIRFFIRNSKAFNEAQRKGLLERQKQGDRYVDPPVPGGTFRHVLFSEYWSTPNQTPRVELQALTSSAYKHLIEQMRWLVDDRNPSIGSTCKNYLLGDALAEPEGALVWFPTKRVLGEFGEANVMAYTPRQQVAAGAERRVVSQEALRQRFLLTEEANWDIASYQEMVDFAVAELPAIPLEIIKAACGNKADVGDRAPRHGTSVQTGFTPTNAGYDPMADAQNRYAAGSTPAPTPAPNSVPVGVPASVPVASVPTEVTYLVGIPGGAATPTPASALPALLAQAPTAMVQLNGAWVALTTSGLVVAPVSVPTTVPVTATVPVSVPASVPAAAEAPVTTVVAAAAPTESVDDYRRKICPDERYARLTPAGLAEVNDVAQSLLAHRTENKPVDASMMQRVAQVSRPDYLG